MSASAMDQGNVYTGVSLDRAAQRRGDPAWLRARLADPSSRIVPLWRGKSLITDDAIPRAVPLSPAALGARLDAWADFVLLGVEGNVAYFAHDLSDLDEAALGALAGSARFEDLRAVGGLLPGPEAGLLAFARGILYWHRRHHFCGVCGAPTGVRDGGHLRLCENAACGAQHFPRTDPAVIMLVSDGERALLGRNRNWAPGLYSTLAGFVEPGESLEEAVRREVLEEAGVPVSEVLYHSSQPWPFPASLMLGFLARARATSVHVNPRELEDARWFSRRELDAAGDWLQGLSLAEAGDGRLRLPRADSLARRLIDDWRRGAAR